VQYGNLISVKNLYKSFGKLSVLNDISININSSDVVVVVGPSGSGKRPSYDV
jgi:polar amino acid transport system ATP-binding protein